MLKTIGVSSIDELFENIGPELRLSHPLSIEAASEMEILRETKELSKLGRVGLACFAGGGVYDHFIPSAVSTIINRPEFATAYTPYQPEVAQGTLQVIYEFQTHICRLTGMEIANASMYDGATAAAEAILMSMRATRRRKVVISETVSPLYRSVIKTYLSASDCKLVEVPMSSGRTDINRLHEDLDDKTACVLISQPNFFGLLEEPDGLAEVVHKAGAKLVMAVDPIAQTLLRTPADLGADIVVGEGQPLGLPISFGRPLLGFLAARMELARQMPGRIAGRTTDTDGTEGFVLTLQTREQHIRREKATSNICTNQALCATAAAVYMTLMGKEGLKKVAMLSMENSHRLAERLFEIEGLQPYFEGDFIREFTVRVHGKASEVILSLLERQLLAGIDVGRWYPGMDDCLLIAVTEKRTEAEIDRLVFGLRELAVHNVVSQM